MLTAAMISGGIALAIGLFFLLLHPFVCIFECVISKKYTGGKKALWILLSLFFGFLASLVYSIFITKSPKLRRVSIQGLTIGALSLACAVGIAFNSPEVGERLAVFTGGAKAMAEGESATDEFDAMLKQLEEFSSEAEKLADGIDTETEAYSSDATRQIEAALEQLQSGHLASTTSVSSDDRPENPFADLDSEVTNLNQDTSLEEQESDQGENAVIDAELESADLEVANTEARYEVESVDTSSTIDVDTGAGAPEDEPADKDSSFSPFAALEALIPKSSKAVAPQAGKTAESAAVGLANSQNATDSAEGQIPASTSSEGLSTQSEARPSAATQPVNRYRQMYSGQTFNTSPAYSAPVKNRYLHR